MAKAPLVERDIEAGRQLVQALKRKGVTVRSARWRYVEGSWRLYLVVPSVRTRGRFALYETIRSMLDGASLRSEDVFLYAEERDLQPVVDYEGARHDDYVY